jgi:Tfp pilus assembly protein PilO
MNKKNIISVIVFTLVALIAAGVLAYAFMVLVRWKQEEQSLRQEIAQEEQKEKRLTVLRSGFEGIKEDEAKLDNYFYRSTEEDWLRFVNSIEQIAQISGAKSEVRAAEFSPGQPFAVDINISGTWKDCYRFFVALDSFPARITIKKFSLQGEGNPKDAKPESKWTGNISLELASIRK